MSTTTDPPPPFLDFARVHADPFICGFNKQPLHEAPARALNGLLEDLAQPHLSGAQPHPDRPIPFQAVSQALQAPPHNHSEASIKDLQALLQKFLRTHRRPVAGPGRQRRYAPLAISDGWMFSATPHYVFARTTQEQRQDYLAAQQARQVIAGMSFKQRLAATRSPRYEFPDKPTSPSPQQRKLMKLAMRKLIAEAEAEENPDQ